LVRARYHLIIRGSTGTSRGPLAHSTSGGCTAARATDSTSTARYVRPRAVSGKL